MCNGQDVAAGFVFINLQKTPQVFRFGTALRSIGCGRDRLAGLVCTIPVDHYAMEVLARWHLGCPFITDEGSEFAGVVVFLGGFNRLRPGAFVHLGIGVVHDVVGISTPRK